MLDASDNVRERSLSSGYDTLPRRAGFGRKGKAGGSGVACRPAMFPILLPLEKNILMPPKPPGTSQLWAWTPSAPYLRPIAVFIQSEHKHSAMQHELGFSFGDFIQTTNPWMLLSSSFSRAGVTRSGPKSICHLTSHRLGPSRVRWRAYAGSKRNTLRYHGDTWGFGGLCTNERGRRRRRYRAAVFDTAVGKQKKTRRGHWMNGTGPKDGRGSRVASPRKVAAWKMNDQWNNGIVSQVIWNAVLTVRIKLIRGKAPNEVATSA